MIDSSGSNSEMQRFESPAPAGSPLSVTARERRPFVAAARICRLSPPRPRRRKSLWRQYVLIADTVIGMGDRRGASRSHGAGGRQTHSVDSLVRFDHGGLLTDEDAACRETVGAKPAPEKVPPTWNNLYDGSRGVRRLDGCAAVSIAHLTVGRTSLRRPRGMTELRI
jgi:hypothetical protein